MIDDVPATVEELHGRLVSYNNWKRSNPVLSQKPDIGIITVDGDRRSRVFWAAEGWCEALPISDLKVWLELERTGECKAAMRLVR